MNSWDFAGFFAFERMLVDDLAKWAVIFSWDREESSSLKSRDNDITIILINWVTSSSIDRVELLKSPIIENPEATCKG